MQKFGKVLLFLGVLLCFSGLLSSAAMAEEEESALSLGVEIDYASRYISRGVDVNGDNDPSIQPSAYIEYAISDALSVGYCYWGNYNLETSTRDEDDHEFYLSYALTDTVTLDAGYIYYVLDLEDTDSDGWDEAYVGATVSLNDYLSTSGKVIFGVGSNNDGYYYAKVSADGEYSINDTFGLFGSVALGYTDDGEDFSDFSDLPISLGVSADLGNGLSSFVSVTHSISLDDAINEEDETFVTVGVAFDF